MSTSISLNNSNPGPYYRAIDGHLFSDLKDEAIILNLSNGTYYGLNAAGVAIWKVLQARTTSAEIESVLMRQFDVDAERCRAEINSFLRKMTDENLVEIIDEQTP